MATSETNPLSHSEQMAEYRNWLIAADQKSSESYDKAVMTLAGGALGLSLTFLKDIIKVPHPEFLWLLGTSWVCLTLSLTCILISMLSSQWALRKAIKQVDQGLVPAVRAGGGFAIMTEILNVLSATTLVIGVLLLAGFSISNFSS
jgi:hypothetical protein